MEVEVGIVSGYYCWGEEAVGRACLTSTSEVVMQCVVRYKM
jgi:hypothetical protein